MSVRLQALPGERSLVRKVDPDEGLAEIRRALRERGEGSAMVPTPAARKFGDLE